MSQVRPVSARFITSAVEEKGWPAGLGPEVAFCGRSNVGKSTLLNALCGRAGLARVSRTPGRTRLLNFFGVTLRDGEDRDTEVVLADLPGFGYAQVSRAERAGWRSMVERYFVGRAALRAVVVLVDSRRAQDVGDDPALLQEERDLAVWLSAQGKAVVVVMTKADKLGKSQRKPAAEKAARFLGCGAPVVFSALAETAACSDGLWRRLSPRLLSAGSPAQPGAAIIDT